jgi:hypothetical protein
MSPLKHQSLILAVLILLNTISFAQTHKIILDDEFAMSEPKIEWPNQFHMPSHINAYPIKKLNLTLKSVLIDNTLSNYDSMGRIVSEVKKEGTNKTTTLYTYQNNILIQKQKIIEADKSKAKKLNREAEIEAERDLELATYEYNDTNNYYIVYNATTNQDNQVVSYTKKEFKTLQGKRKLISESLTNITYTDGQVTTIESSKSTTRFFYQNGLLIKKEVFTPGMYQDRKEVDKYRYNSKQNLVSIWKETTYGKGERIDSYSERLIDTATYDEKNRAIRIGVYEGYVLFKYDDNNNVILSQFYQKPNELFDQKEYIYNEQNQLKSYKETHYKNNKSWYFNDNTFTYEDSLLTEITQTSSNPDNNSKTFYTYDENQRLVLKTEYKIINNKVQKDEVINQINYTLSDKTLQIFGNYSVNARYIFY